MDVRNVRVSTLREDPLEIVATAEVWRDGKMFKFLRTTAAAQGVHRNATAAATVAATDAAQRALSALNEKIEAERTDG